MQEPALLVIIALAKHRIQTEQGWQKGILVVFDFAVQRLRSVILVSVHVEQKEQGKETEQEEGGRGGRDGTAGQRQYSWGRAW
eukprot:2932131-Rhodomonas_salina.1